MRVEAERVGMAEPAAERLREPAMMAFRRIEEGRRAGAAIEEFVTAADGEIDAAAGKVERQHACRMREVPDHQRAGLMRGAGQPRHVVDGAVAVIDVAEHQHRRVGVEAVDDGVGVGGMDKLVAPAALPDHPLGDVVVGREIPRLGHDPAPVGTKRQCRRHRLEQVHRGAVGGDDTGRIGPDQRRDAGPDTRRKVDPPGLVPASDQAVPPFALECRGHPRGDIARQRAERVPVEIDHAVRKREGVAMRREPVFGVAGKGAFEALTVIGTGGHLCCSRGGESLDNR